MDLDALLDASFLNYDGPLKDRLAHKGNQTTSEFLLEQVKLAVQELDPELDPGDTLFHTAVTLLAAACMVGPRIDLLVQFTAYATTFVADIAQRMRAYELWSDEEVCADYWFEGDKVGTGFWLDCLVAQGLVCVQRTKEGEDLYSVFDPKAEGN